LHRKALVAVGGRVPSRRRASPVGLGPAGALFCGTSERSETFMKAICRVLLVSALLPAAARADETTPQAPASPAPAPAVEGTSGSESKLAVHGYLTEGYARGVDDQLVIGIPEDGTTNYRRVALQFRYSPTQKDNFLVQFAQRRLGESPSMALEPDVKIDWAFYEHKFESGTSVRVGRMATPLGIYNEIRYVGTVLPFYRAPYNFYQEGSFTSEGIDGIRIAQTIKPTSDWNAELVGFGGGFNMVESLSGSVNQARAESAFGGQIWLNTPVSGLRLGVGGERYSLRNSIVSSYADHSDEVGLWIASAEFSSDRYRLRSELSELHYQSIQYTLRSYYIYGGWNLTDKLTANLQFDNGRGAIAGGGPVVQYPNQYRDATAGLDYAFRSDLVAKAEYHVVKARLIEDEPVALGAPPVSANYYILSLSVSF
jgi:hypothetical protein